MAVRISMLKFDLYKKNTQTPFNHTDPTLPPNFISDRITQHVGDTRDTRTQGWVTLHCNMGGFTGKFFPMGRSCAPLISALAWVRHTARPAHLWIFVMVNPSCPICPEPARHQGWCRPPSCAGAPSRSAWTAHRAVAAAERHLPHLAKPAGGPSQQLRALRLSAGVPRAGRFLTGAAAVV